MTNRVRAMASRTRATATRVAGNKEGEGSNVMARATRVVGKRW